MNLLHFAIYYLSALNIGTFFLMGLDKYKATRNAWRIREKTFFLLAFLGGSLGCLFGMHLFRHKTKHAKFYLGMPFLFFLQCIIVFLIWIR